MILAFLGKEFGLKQFNYPVLGGVFLRPFNKSAESFAFCYKQDLAMDERFSQWSKKYFDSAEYVSNALFHRGKSQIAQLDSYFLPITFLYRHSLELLIKAIIIKKQGIDSAQRLIKDGFHNIKNLIESTTIKEYQSEYPNEINWILTFARSLSDFDESSDSFRYPFKVIMDNKVPKLSYVFDKRYDIDLIVLFNQFKIAYAIISQVYESRLENIPECSKVSPIFMTIGGYYYGKAVLGLGYDMGLAVKYNRGFEEVAEILQEQSQQFLLPICYLKRNNIELELKTMYLSFVSGDDWNKHLEQVKDAKHKICKLWKMLKPVLDKAYFGREDEINLIADYLQKLHSFDTDAAHFRYPTDKCLNAYSIGSQKYDGENMILFIDSLYNAIEGVYMCIEEYFSNNELSRRYI